MTMRLVYLGPMLRGDKASPKLWNIVAPGSPWHMSSRTLEGLKQIGIVKGDL
jgi:hypothetical protein